MANCIACRRELPEGFVYPDFHRQVNSTQIAIGHGDEARITGPLPRVHFMADKELALETDGLSKEPTLYVTGRRFSALPTVDLGQLAAQAGYREFILIESLGEVSPEVFDLVWDKGVLVFPGDGQSSPEIRLGKYALGRYDFLPVLAVKECGENSLHLLGGDPRRFNLIPTEMWEKEQER